MIKAVSLLNLSLIRLTIFIHLNAAAHILDPLHRRSCFSLGSDHEKLENLSPFPQQKAQEISKELPTIIVEID